MELIGHRRRPATGLAHRTAPSEQTQVMSQLVNPGSAGIVRTQEVSDIGPQSRFTDRFFRWLRKAMQLLFREVMSNKIHVDFSRCGVHFIM